jgi:signal transduction histidine kinase
MDRFEGEARMSQPGTLAAALAFVPNLWQETADPFALDSLLTGWSKACGWRACGLVLPCDGAAPVVRTLEGGSRGDSPPVEVPDALRRIRGGETTVLYSAAGSAGRLFAGVQPLGRPLGLLWAERVAGQPWSEAEREYLVLTARTLERAPAVAAVVGPLIDPERLSQRLADASVIAGRMAHDFDNILTGIIGFSDLTQPMLQPGSQAAGFVGEIAKVGQRGIQFTQQLHQLSRSGQVKPSPASVAAAVAKEELRLKPHMNPNLRIEKDLASSLPPVAIDGGPLQAVVGHLMENAIEASQNGGVIRITARTTELSEAEARTYLGRPGLGTHLLVTIADSGVGMKPEVRRRLLVEPFFTTKVRHRGLGLAIAYRVLCAHRGGIQIDAVPSPGTGTQVRVVLPLAAARPPAAAGAPNGHAVSGSTVSATAVRG